jgi:benzodiazapine receptor
MRTVAGTSLAVTAAATIGGVSGDFRSAWYRSLDKPGWQPPGAVFPVVWTVLYTDIAVAGARVADQLARRGRLPERRAFLTALGVNLALNAAWTPLFTRARRPTAAAVECGVLALSGVDLVRRAARADAPAAAALAPYAAWCAFATVLSGVIARRNPGR